MVKFDEPFGQYKRCVITDSSGSELTINLRASGISGVCDMNEKEAVGLKHEDIKELAAFFAQFL